MNFSIFAQYLLQIEKITSRNEMTKVLAKMFAEIGENEIDKAVYLLQGRVVPLFMPAEFNLSEKTLIRAIGQAFNKPEAEITKIFKEKGDLGEVMGDMKNSTTKQDFSISAVYQKLFELTTVSGQGTVAQKLRLISTLLRETDKLSGKYIVRLLLNKLRLGFSDATILDAFSWMISGDKNLKPEIEKKYNIHPDLGFIAKTLKIRGAAGLPEIMISPGTPILMARCERAKNADEILSHGLKFAVEDKFDGFRLQIHLAKKSRQNEKSKSNNLFSNEEKNEDKEVNIFSRNLENVTAMYPDIKKEILAAFPTCHSLIIEGEAVGINPQTGETLPFQETVQRKRKYDIIQKAKDIPLKLIIFEILYLDGQSLINCDFATRRVQLEKLIQKRSNKPDSKILVLSEVTWCSKPLEIEGKFSAAAGRNMEGVVAKKADGVYQAGARGWNWIKLKRGFQGQKMSDTIDCVVMGYDFGQGKRSVFGIGDFLIGVYNEKSEKFETLAKIGTGLTDEEWKTIKKDIDAVAVKIKPENYEVEKTMTCDVWAKPKIVVEIMADEITRSPTHTAGTGLALRFPRLVRFRPDKKTQEITTSQDVEKMYKLQ